MNTTYWTGSTHRVQLTREELYAIVTALEDAAKNSPRREDVWKLPGIRQRRRTFGKVWRDIQLDLEGRYFSVPHNAPAEPPVRRLPGSYGSRGG